MLHTLFPAPAACIAGCCTRSMRGIAFLDAAVVGDLFGNGPEVNGCAQGLEVQEQLAFVALATAARAVQQSSVSAANKMRASLSARALHPAGRGALTTRSRLRTW